MRKALPFVLLLCTGMMLAGFVYLLNSKINPQTDLKQLTKDQLGISLQKWRGTLQNCQDIDLTETNCKLVGAYSTDYQLPLQSALNHSDALNANQVNLIYRFNESELAWVKTQNQIELILARSIGNSVQLKLAQANYTRLGSNNRDVIFRLRAADIVEQEYLELNIRFAPGLPFGPLETPPMLVRPEVTPDIIKMPVRTISNLNVVRGLEFSTVLFLLILAIVLDHKKSFLLLAAYFYCRMIKSFVMFYLETESITYISNGMASGSHFNSYLQSSYLVATLAAMLILPNFALAVFDVSWKNRINLAISAIATGIYGVFLFLANPDQLWIYSDILAESLAAASLLFLMPVIFKFSNRRKIQTNLEQLFSERRRDRRLSSHQLKALFIAIGALSTLWVNYVEFQSTFDYGFKDTLQLSLLIMPSLLIITALIDVGFTSKTLERNARRIAQNELIAKDVQDSKHFQDDLIPWKKISGQGWQARNFYYPSLTLAGDWFDITEIKINDRDFLACCLVDVVGHGISAGIVSSIVASQWRQWSAQLQSQAESPEVALHNFSKSLHQAMASVKNQKDCAVSAFLLNLETSELWYFTAGQPPIVIENQGQFTFLSTLGDRIGISGKVSIAQRLLQAGDTMLLFTDGLIPPKYHFSRWQKRLTTEIPKQPLALWLLQQIRSNKKQFRNNRSLEDDMTALIISFPKAEGLLKHAG